MPKHGARRQEKVIETRKSIKGNDVASVKQMLGRRKTKRNIKQFWLSLQIITYG